MDDLKLKIILVILVAVAFLTGFVIYRNIASKSVETDTNFEPIPVFSSSSVPSASPTLPQRISAVSGQATASATTKGGQTLPATGMPIVLVGVFAGAAVASGFFLRKFPE